MNEKRHKFAGAHHSQLGFLVSGGWQSSTTEITTDGMTFNAYTPLPLALLDHCLVALDRDDGEFFLAGGRTEYDAHNGTYIHRDNHWDNVHDMPTRRYGKKSYLKKSLYVYIGWIELQACHVAPSGIVLREECRGLLLWVGMVAGIWTP